MPDKSGSDGQPTLEKLEREGVSIRKCISYEGAGEYSGNGGSSTKSSTTPKAPPMRSGKGGGY